MKTNDIVYPRLPEDGFTIMIVLCSAGPPERKGMVLWLAH